jgi:phosphate transport system protein
MIQDAMDAFLAQDVEKAAAVWQKDDDVDQKFVRIMTLVQTRMKEDKNTIDEGTQLIFIARCCERIGDHITNIAEDIQYMALGPDQSDPP